MEAVVKAVASIENRLSHGDVVHVLRKPHILEIEYFRRSIEGTLCNKPDHLCALILRSLKNSSNISTSEEDSGRQRDLSHWIYLYLEMRLV